LVVGHDDLTLVVENPLHAGLLHSIDEILVAISHQSLHGVDHLLLEVAQPHLNVGLGVDSIYQLY